MAGTTADHPYLFGGAPAGLLGRSNGIVQCRGTGIGCHRSECKSADSPRSASVILCRVGTRSMNLEPLFDGHGRRISDLRVSVTDRCNFRCRYCMPADGLPWLPREEVLSFEEIERLVSLLSRMGIEDVRLTGGDALAEAGLRRINVSIDSLDRERFAEMTLRDALPRVLRGLAAIARHPQVRPVKVNVVATRGFTEREAEGFCEFARNSQFQVRFIEFMPLDGDRAWKPEAVLTGRELRRIIEAVHPLEELPREPAATARVFRFADGRGEIGFVSPVSEPFCADCNRIRLTADGKLRTCLFSLNETD